VFQTIVVPMDGSKGSAKALEAAIVLATAEHAELAICCVVDPILVVGTEPPSTVTDLVLADRENEARQTMKAAIEKALQRGVKSHGEVRLAVATLSRKRG
jgi:nucleotide-binding universal stress UspA family protein